MDVASSLGQNYLMSANNRLQLLALGTCLLLAAPVEAVTPSSPEVKSTIEKGLKFLESDTSETRLGGHCLIGLAFLKNGRDLSHPKVQAALQACEAFAKSSSAEATGTDNYSAGLALIFLCELDPVKHESSARRIVGHVLARQQSYGAWTYTGTAQGDTSQTQYAALGLWMADASGIEVPQESIERLCGWLLRTQDPSGAWGYHGQDPGSMTRMKQDPIRHSLAAAGLGSVYICADLLGISDPSEGKTKDGLPPALLEVQQKGGKSRRGQSKSKVIDSAAVLKSMADGNQWFAEKFAVESSEWTHYYLYGLERYLSFRELAEGRREREPEWYNQVFAYLARSQKTSGAWADNNETEVVNTAFAVLCLSRSTQTVVTRKFKALGDGVLLGGMGLPANISDLQERNGKVVESPLAGSVEEILAIIEDPDNPELGRLAESGQSVELDSDVTRRSGQVARLRSLVSAGSYESRLVAVKSLGKVRDLDNVPVLLYALTDPDVRIVRQADQALRFISRKFRGVGMPLDPEPVEIKAAQKAWKEWYLSIRPDAELLE